MKDKQVAGEVAIGIARQIVDPMRELRDRLGLVIDQLERHIATSTGPAPYPWRSVQALRADLAEAYLNATRLARRLDELERAVHVEPLGSFDAAAGVDLGLRLAGEDVTSGIEVVMDLGSAPPAKGAVGPFALVVAQLVSASARSAKGLAGSAMSVRIAVEDGAIVVSIADNGAGIADAVELGDLARLVIGPWGGSVDAASTEGQGCVFELRLQEDRG